MERELTDIEKITNDIRSLDRRVKALIQAGTITGSHTRSLIDDAIGSLAVNDFLSLKQETDAALHAATLALKAFESLGVAGVYDLLVGFQLITDFKYGSNTKNVEIRYLDDNNEWQYETISIPTTIEKSVLHTNPSYTINTKTVDGHELFDGFTVTSSKSTIDDNGIYINETYQSGSRTASDIVISSDEKSSISESWKTLIATDGIYLKNDQSQANPTAYINSNGDAYFTRLQSVSGSTSITNDGIISIAQLLDSNGNPIIDNTGTVHTDDLTIGSTHLTDALTLAPNGLIKGTDGVTRVSVNNGSTSISSSKLLYNDGSDHTIIDGSTINVDNLYVGSLTFNTSIPSITSSTSPVTISGTNSFSFDTTPVSTLSITGTDPIIGGSKINTTTNSIETSMLKVNDVEIINAGNVSVPIDVGNIHISDSISCDSSLKIGDTTIDSTSVTTDGLTIGSTIIDANGINTGSVKVASTTINDSISTNALKVGSTIIDADATVLVTTDNLKIGSKFTASSSGITSTESIYLGSTVIGSNSIKSSNLIVAGIDVAKNNAIRVPIEIGDVKIDSDRISSGTSITIGDTVIGGDAITTDKLIAGDVTINDGVINVPSSMKIGDVTINDAITCSKVVIESNDSGIATLEIGDATLIASGSVLKLNRAFVAESVYLRSADGSKYFKLTSNDVRDANTVGKMLVLEERPKTDVVYTNELNSSSLSIEQGEFVVTDVDTQVTAYTNRANEWNHKPLKRFDELDLLKIINCTRDPELKGTDRSEGADLYGQFYNRYGSMETGSRTFFNLGWFDKPSYFTFTKPIVHSFTWSVEYVANPSNLQWNSEEMSNALFEFVLLSKDLSKEIWFDGTNVLKLITENGSENIDASDYLKIDAVNESEYVIERITIMNDLSELVDFDFDDCYVTLLLAAPAVEVNGYGSLDEYVRFDSYTYHDWTYRGIDSGEVKTTYTLGLNEV